LIRLKDKETGADLGTISEEGLQFLVDQLEEEFDEDRDYYIQRELIDVLAGSGADSQLINTLRTGIGDCP
jgi:hypothetical protein